MDKTKRDSLIAKIRALRAKTAAAGCTEAEALAAQQVADRLMREHDVDLTEAQVKEEKIEFTSYVFSTDGKKHPLRWMWKAIDAYCDTRSTWFVLDSDGVHSCEIWGAPADRELACYFYDLCRTAIDGDFLEYAFRNRVKRTHANLNSFGLGMTSRMGERLLEMKAARSDAGNGTGTALVPVKRAMVDNAVTTAHPKMGKVRATTVRGDHIAAGRAAGDRVALNTGIGQRQAPAQIGSR